MKFIHLWQDWSDTLTMHKESLNQSKHVNYITTIKHVIILSRSPMLYILFIYIFLTLSRVNVVFRWTLIVCLLFFFFLKNCWLSIGGHQNRAVCAKNSRSNASWAQQLCHSFAKTSCWAGRHMFVPVFISHQHWYDPTHPVSGYTHPPTPPTPLSYFLYSLDHCLISLFVGMV